MLVVEPVSDPLAEQLPLGAVREHALATEPVELRHAQRLDVLLAGESQPLLDFDLDRQPVRIPSRLALDAKSFHRAMTAEQILDGAREHVMDAGSSVRRRRTFEEHERRRTLAFGERARKEILLAPSREQCQLQLCRGLIGGHEGETRLRHAGDAHIRSRTPRTSAVSFGSARAAVAMIVAISAGSSASGRH